MSLPIKPIPFYEVDRPLANIFFSFRHQCQIVASLIRLFVRVVVCLGQVLKIDKWEINDVEILLRSRVVLTGGVKIRLRNFRGFLD